MSDYTLIDEIKKLGGVVRSSTDYSPYLRRQKILAKIQSAESSRAGSPRPGCATFGIVSPEYLGDDVPLSMAHISPFIEWRAGASLLKSSKGGQVEQVGGGKRKSIKGFSIASRRRLMQTIAGVRRDAQLPIFITLTYPSEFPNPKQSKKHLDIFFKRMARRFPNHGSIWKLEPQERGAPHYHILTWSIELDDLSSFVPYSWFDIAGNNDVKHLHWHLGLLGRGNRPCVQAVNSFNGVWSYASKYLGKTFDVSGWSEKWTGRYWGVVNRENIPFGELVNIPVSYSQAVTLIRYQRRFAGLRSRSSRSQTIYCDADQWIQKMQIGGDANEIKDNVTALSESEVQSKQMTP